LFLACLPEIHEKLFQDLLTHTNLFPAANLLPKFSFEQPR
jgi:hypothetical protein